MSEIQTEKPEMANLHICLLSICILLLCYDYYYTSNPVLVRIKDPKFNLNGPYYNETLKANDVYEKLIDITNFTFITNPQPCKNYTAGILLVIIVSSNPSNYENRKVIRNTWGKTVDSTKIVFLLGETDNTTNINRIKHEHKAYGDIVQGSFIDAYRNMTYKHVMGLKWVAHYCPMAKYVLKTDDDVVLNSREMRRFIAKELSPWGATGMIMCQVLERAQAQRSDRSKWKVTTAEYASYYYPTYCAGWAILYSQDVVTKLLEAAQDAPYFWIDDVHITGILAQKIGVARTSLSSLILTQKQADVLRNLGPSYVGPFVLGPPDLNVARMVQIWKAIPA